MGTESMEKEGIVKETQFNCTEFLLEYRLCFIGPNLLWTKDIYCELSIKPFKEIFSEFCQHYNFSNKCSKSKRNSFHLPWGVLKCP
jgi:hypothetical protein